MSALPPKADMDQHCRDVRFVPKAEVALASSTVTRAQCLSLHAGLGAVGLLLVLYAALTTGISNVALAALVILAIAALGGFYLASIHLRGTVAQQPIVFVHAGVAVIGFLTLLAVVFGAF